MMILAVHAALGAVVGFLVASILFVLFGKEISIAAMKDREL